MIYNFFFSITALILKVTLAWEIKNTSATCAVTHNGYSNIKDH